MAAQLRVYDYAIVTIDGRAFELGSLNRPRFITLDGEKEERTVKVEVSSTQKIWDVTESHLGNFDFCWIQSDYDVVVEFIVDDGADVGEVAFTLDSIGTGRAKEYGPALKLNSDDSFANNTVGFTGTVDVIERITVKNESATNIAQVYIALFT